MPLQQIQELLDDMKAERSDFVLEETYGEIMSTLQSRIEIIEKLRHLPAPRSPEELEELKEVVRQYDRLRENAKKASVAFADYLKKSPATPN
jgi:hypothetical protein